MRRRLGRGHLLVLLALLVGLVGACTSGSSRTGQSSAAASSPSRPPTAVAPTAPTPSDRPGTPTPPPSTRPTTTPSTRVPSTTAVPAAPAQQALARMSLAERVGQLLMVHCPSTGVSAATRRALSSHHVGAVILDGTSTAGVRATRAVTDRLRRLSPGSVGLLVAADQEGGQVQRLQGPGFTRIVSAVEQGRIDPSRLRDYAHGWGTQLRRAGVNLNLAPVLDTVPAGFGSNPPIGDLDREYGTSPAAVTRHGLAVLRGEMAAGIAVTAKHFPGLGRVHGNTDLTSEVTDTTTTRHDAYLAPFRAAIEARVGFVMISTADYARIDPGTPAAFSKTIVTGMLRHDLGFDGVIVSDDLGAARQVSGYPVGKRAVAFVAAGGDLVLTVDATQAGSMTRALIREASSEPAFRSKVDAAALRVLRAKQDLGLL